MALFPTFDVPQIVPNTPQRDTDAPSGLFFDEEKGDFLLDGSGRMIIATPKESWEQWCMKAVGTERYALLAYSNQFGVEMEAAFSQPTREAQESSIQRTITECLFADPRGRTKIVNNFNFAWGTNFVRVDYDVTGDNGKASLTAEFEVR